MNEGGKAIPDFHLSGSSEQRERAVRAVLEIVWAAARGGKLSVGDVERLIHGVGELAGPVEKALGTPRE